MHKQKILLHIINIYCLILAQYIYIVTKLKLSHIYVLLAYELSNILSLFFCSKPFINDMFSLLLIDQKIMMFFYPFNHKLWRSGSLYIKKRITIPFLWLCSSSRTRNKTLESTSKRSMFLNENCYSIKSKVFC
jgi:hypothetical protein